MVGAGDSFDAVNVVDGARVKRALGDVMLDDIGQSQLVRLIRREIAVLQIVMHRRSGLAFRRRFFKNTLQIFCCEHSL